MSIRQQSVGIFFLLALFPIYARADKPSPNDAPAPRPAADASKAFTLPSGFKATLFAGEPDLVQPIAFTIDGKGRLWVVESLTYPHWLAADAKEGKDLIVIYEDTDGDGHFDKRTVFADKIPNASGIEVGFGGVYICSTPRLIFIPDKDGDDIPDGPPEVLLDGWNLEKAGHNVFNGIMWGPDGWLYGMNGIQSKSAVGKPGTPDEKRVKFDCGVWRFHPITHVVEAFAWGTTNPWGMDFDDYGRMFITNCVIAHLWHVIPGAHFPRMYGEDYNSHTFGVIQSCADHLHFQGQWQEVRGTANNNSDLGGGHAHVGAMIYLGDNWPDEYRGGLFTCNLHGHRINHDVFELKGSGVVAHHGADVMLANDTWFRGLTLRYGPDGSVFVSDWCGTGECHDADVAEMDNGRIFKITYGDAKPEKVNIGALSDPDLVTLQLRKNDWYVRAARLELQQRAAAKKLQSDSVVPALRKILAENNDVTRRLRALWTLHCTGQLLDGNRLDLLSDKDANIRGWAIRLQLESKSAPDAFLTKLAELAKTDTSPAVRLEIASALQRVDLDKRWPIVENLIAHAEDAADQNIPMMDWYAIEPLVGADQAKALGLLARTKIPVLREYITRRLAMK